MTFCPLASDNFFHTALGSTTPRVPHKYEAAAISENAPGKIRTPGLKVRNLSLYLHEAKRVLASLSKLSYRRINKQLSWQYFKTYLQYIYKALKKLLC